MKKQSYSLLLIIFTFLSFTSYGQEVKLVKDINSTPSPDVSFNPSGMTEYNGKLYFNGTDAKGTSLPSTI